MRMSTSKSETLEAVRRNTALDFPHPLMNVLGVKPEVG